MFSCSVSAYILLFRIQHPQNGGGRGLQLLVWGQKTSIFDQKTATFGRFFMKNGKFWYIQMLQIVFSSSVCPYNLLFRIQHPQNGGGGLVITTYHEAVAGGPPDRYPQWLARALNSTIYDVKWDYEGYRTTARIAVFYVKIAVFLYQIFVVVPHFVNIREISLFSRVFTGIYVDLEGLWLTP